MRTLDPDKVVFNRDPALRDQSKRQRIYLVFRVKDAPGEVVRIVIEGDGDGGLDDNWARVHFRTNKMYRAAGEPGAVGYNAGVCMEAFIGREQRWVNIDQPVAPSVDKAGRQKPHESR